MYQDFSGCKFVPAGKHRYSFATPRSLTAFSFLDDTGGDEWKGMSRRDWFYTPGLSGQGQTNSFELETKYSHPGACFCSTSGATDFQRRLVLCRLMTGWGVCVLKTRFRN